MAYRRSLDFLPSFFRSDVNSKFLNATLDQLISEPDFKRLNGYAGRQFSPSYRQGDGYINEPNNQRQNYQLEPSSIYRDDEDKIKLVSGYQDLLDRINNLGGITTDHSRLFSAYQYSYDGGFDFDKFANYSNYYWLPQGPDPVNVASVPIDFEKTYLVTPPKLYQTVNGIYEAEAFDANGFDSSINPFARVRNDGYTITGYGTKVNPNLRLARGGSYTFKLDQLGHGFFIQTQPGLQTGESWQQNLSIRDVMGVVNNGEDVGTVTFNVPAKDAQDFYINMPKAGTADLIAQSKKKNRQLRYVDVQYQSYDSIYSLHSGIDGQRFLEGKTIMFLPDPALSAVPSIWTAYTDYQEGDLVRYGNTLYRALTAFTSGRTFGTNNLEIFDANDDWYDPVPFDNDDIPFDTTNFDRGADISLADRSAIYRINIVDGIIKLSKKTNTTANTKITINEGIVYGNREVFHNSQDEVELIPNITANKDFLYYQDGLDPSVYGVIEVINQDVDGAIYVDETIVGAKNYISPNGVTFTNGLKVKFRDNIVPSTYKDNEYYVEGVGASIELVPVSELVTPEDWLDTLSVTFDTTGYDTGPFDSETSNPLVKDYITINRASRDRNSWTRTNRWFHEQVISATADYNGFAASLNFNSKAKRPIIEFRPNLQLFNHGRNAKTPISLIDFVTKDAFSNVEGKAVDDTGSIISSYSVDGVLLLPGMRVIFAADTDTDVRNKIYEVAWIRPQSSSDVRTISFILDGSTATFDLGFDVNDPINLEVQIDGVNANDAGYNWSLTDTQTLVFDSNPPYNAPSAGQQVTASLVYKQQIHLALVDGNINEGDTITITQGLDYKGKQFYYNGSDWKLAQEKIKINQPPNFDLVDVNDISFGNSVSYPSNDFRGNQIFGYDLAATGSNDAELGLKLKYRSFNNIGDILFKDYINNSSFLYRSDNNSINKSTAGSRFILNKADGTREYINQWQKNYFKSQQYQTETFFASQYQTNNFLLNQSPLDREEPLSQESILVYVNNRAVNNSKFDIELILGQAYLVLDTDLAVGDKLDVKISTSNTNSKSVFEIPSDLGFNPLNEEVNDFTLGHIRDHIITTFEHTPGLEGDFTGSNNSRDLGNIKQWGGKIVQNSGSTHLANLFLNDTQANFNEAVIYNMREYSRFKSRLLEMLRTMSLTRPMDPIYSLDEVLVAITANKSEVFPWHASDMLPYGEDYTKLTYTISDQTGLTFDIGQVYDYTQPNDQALNVYHNGNLLVRNLEYVVDIGAPTITFIVSDGQSFYNQSTLTLQIGDKIEIRRYSSTDGIHVPPTPTKLGLYPAFIPQYVTDGRPGYTRSMLRGHDGSLTALFGDHRDDCLLEFERRIYNNLKVTYTGDLHDFRDYVPGGFKDTPFNKTEFDQILSGHFNSWLGRTGLKIGDYVTPDSNDPWTWNYFRATSKVDGNIMPATYWRGIYKYYFDTDAPHLRPWEMLGFADEPIWWTFYYGSAPYTRGNSVLWDDISRGYIPAGDRQGVDPRYLRPNLIDYIPVDESGNLLDPLSSVVKDYNKLAIEGPFSFGDGSPVETAWRQSSEYPFVLQLALALTAPSEYFGGNIDKNRQILRNFGEGNDQWVFSDTGLRRDVTQLIHGETDDNGAKVKRNGYPTWMSEYAKSLGLDITKAVGDKLRYSTVQLSYKMSGYSDKKLLKIYADQASPNSVNSSVLIPDEDYDVVLNKSAPVQSLTYSGVIVSKSSTGFSVTGYDDVLPYFVIETSDPSGPREAIKVGNTAATKYLRGTGRLLTVPYGTEFLSAEQVVDFLISYGRYLTAAGFRFNNKLDEDSGFYLDWDLSAREFLFYYQQGWETGIAISLSPVGSSINFTSSLGAVDSLNDKASGTRVLNEDFKILRSNDYSVNRRGRDFNLTTDANDGIYLLDIDVVNYEHVLVFKNRTQFNDVIFEPSIGIRQYRLKVNGYKTDNWDGSFGAAGFIINDDNVETWQAGKNYFKGDIVKFKNVYYTASANIPGSIDFDSQSWIKGDYDKISKGLLPNLSNKAYQFKTFYDVDSVNLESDADRLGKGLIGLRPRSYFENLKIPDTSQAKFYQGLITQKGSKNSLDKLLRAKLDNFDGSISFSEDWAIRLGQYGATDIRQQLQLEIDESKALRDPILIELLDANDTATEGRISYKENDIWAKAKPFTKNYLGTVNGNNLPGYLPTAGYARIDDVNWTSSTFANINTEIDPTGVGVGDLIFIAADRNNIWSIYRINETFNNINTMQIAANGMMTIEFVESHGLAETDVILIKTVGNNPAITSFYSVSSVVSNTKIQVKTNFGQLPSQKVSGTFFKLVNHRFDNSSQINGREPKAGWRANDRLFVDSATSSGWGVYEKQEAYGESTNYYAANPLSLTVVPYACANAGFGTSVAVNKTDSFMLVGQPADNSVVSFGAVDNAFVQDFIIASPSANISSFGNDITISEINTAVVAAVDSDDGTGYAFMLKVIAQTQKFAIEQALAPDSLDVGGHFGRSVSLSEDGNWLAIGQPDVDEGYVWLYQYQEAIIPPPVTQEFIYDGSSLSFLLTGDAAEPQSVDAISVVANGLTLTPIDDYTLSGSTVTLVTAPVSVGGSIFVTVIRAEPEQKFTGDGSTASFILTGDSANPDSIYALKISVNGILQVPFRDYTLSAPSTVVFTSAPADDAGIIIQQHAHFKLIQTFTSTNAAVGDQFGYSVNLTKDGRRLAIGSPSDNNLSTTDSGSIYVFDRTAIEFVADGETDTFLADVQTDSTKVYIDGVIQSVERGDGTGDYQNASGDIIFVNPPSAGALISIENNYVVETARLYAGDYVEASIKLGTSVLMCPTACSLYSGAPYKDGSDNKDNTGSVFRFVNQGRLYGSILGTVVNPVVSPAGYLIINDRWVSISNNSTLDDVVSAINDENIPGVTASNQSGYLKIVSDSVIAADKLKITADDYAVLQDLGLDNIYSLAQIINNPDNEEFGEFGKKLAITPDALTLVVATDRGSSKVPMTFDNDETKFDSDIMRFVDIKTQSGAVNTYQYIGRPDDSIITPGQFISAQRLTSTKIDGTDEFGASVAVSNTGIYVGMPGDDTYATNSGLVAVFKLGDYARAWTLTRSESPKVDIQLLNRISLIDTVSNEIVADLDYIDPFKGKISGVAAQEIDYRVSYDPAVYNIDTNDQTVDTSGVTWGSDQVGRLWWNTSQARWMEYEQGSLEFRVVNWGTAFPRSTIFCLEWTESDLPPSQYLDTNNPFAFVLPGSRYSRIDGIDENGVVRSRYYFWVGGKTATPDVDFRSISAVDVESLIANPKSAGIPYAAMVAPNAIALFNCRQFFKNKDIVLSIDYDVERNEANIHSEYQLVSEGDVTSQPNGQIITKLIDSLSGSDAYGRLVPDPYLSAGRKYGKDFRPRQTMFVDRPQALKTAVDYINGIFKKYPIMLESNITRLFADEEFPNQYSGEYDNTVNDKTELGYLIINILDIGYRVLVKIDADVNNRWTIYEVDYLEDGITKYWKLYRVQSFANNRYLEQIDWLASGINEVPTPDRVVDFNYNLLEISATKDLTVKVKDDGRGLFTIYRYDGSEWKALVNQFGTVKIKDDLWDSSITLQGYDQEAFDLQLFDDWQNIEIQNIIRATYEDILVGELQLEKNNLFFILIQHLLKEQKYVDWIFKTSFIKVEQRQRAIVQLPTYQQDNLDLVSQYISEVKPYHTKIREYIIKYDGNDPYQGDATDFDVPAYYVSGTNSYRSPNGSEAIDSYILDLAAYTPWRDNHKFVVSSITINDGGSGYSAAPEIIISGGGGTGAKAQATVINGVITSVEVTAEGSGYTGTPTVTLGASSGSGASLSARISNDKIRKISSTLKLDRISTPNSGFLVTFKNGSGETVDITAEKISRLDGEAGVIDYLLDILSVSQVDYDPAVFNDWIKINSVDIAYPVPTVPNYRLFPDTSGRIQVFYQKSAEGWTAETLQEALRDLGTSVGANGIDISNTEVVLDGGMTSYNPSVFSWTASTSYDVDDVVVYKNKAYRVTQAHTSGTAFFDDYMVKLTGGDFENHLDRTWAYYQPTSGQLGRDLGQLFSGVEYPGVKVSGASFSLEPGFDVGGYDVQSFDTFVIGPEGVKVLDPSILDQTLYSSFTDTSLGTRPEDIVTKGNKFVDYYGSHAPEEMVPGRVFDTLDIKVYSTPSDDWTGDASLGMSIQQTNADVNGDTEFTYAAPFNKADTLFVFSKQTGTLSEGTDFTVDRITRKLTLLTSLSADDTLFIYAIDSGGPGMLYSDIMMGDGSTMVYELPIDRERINQLYVTVNGEKTTAWTLGTAYSTITFDAAPANGHSIFVYAFYADNVAEQSWTEIHTTKTTLTGNTYPDDYVIDLDRIVGFHQPLNDKLIVTLNGSRLRPPNQAYYTGDGSTTNYQLPTTVYVDPDLVVESEIKVAINGTAKQAYVDWTLDASDGSTVRSITFNEIPVDGDEIVISYLRDAGYRLNDDDTLQISESLSLTAGDKIEVTSFTNHNFIKMRTQVFKGTTAASTTVAIGYDDVGFDSGDFDGITTTLSTVTRYTLSRPVSQMTYLYVTLDVTGSGYGIHLNPMEDYIMLDDTTIELGSGLGISPDSIIVVTHFTEDEQKPSIGFRIFKDMNDSFAYYRMNGLATTTLSNDLTLTDEYIYVQDASILPDPDPFHNIPGQLMIGNERVTYYTRDLANNRLGQIRRGVAGTGAKSTVSAGTSVQDAGPGQAIPNAHDNIWYNAGASTASNGAGLQNSTTEQALFLLAGPVRLGT